MWEGWQRLEQWRDLAGANWSKQGHAGASRGTRGGKNSSLIAPFLEALPQEQRALGLHISSEVAASAERVAEEFTNQLAPLKQGRYIEVEGASSKQLQATILEPQHAKANRLKEEREAREADKAARRRGNRSEASAPLAGEELLQQIQAGYHPQFFSVDLEREILSWAQERIQTGEAHEVTMAGPQPQKLNHLKVMYGTPGEDGLLPTYNFGILK